MTVDALPPVRAAHTWRCADGMLSYDTWSGHGRPVVLLHAVLFDRRTWWPSAADLRADCLPIAVDLPGHGGSPGRADFDSATLVDNLAELIHGLGVSLAPIVVGHASSAYLATMFAAQYATHAVVTVDAAPPTPAASEWARAETAPKVDVEQYLATMQIASVPSCYRALATARPDPTLLAGYLQGRAQRHGELDHSTSVRAGRLAVHSQPPQPDARNLLSASGAQQRTVVYHVPGRFAHLADARRFANDVRALR